MRRIAAHAVLHGIFAAMRVFGIGVAIAFHLGVFLAPAARSAFLDKMFARLEQDERIQDPAFRRMNRVLMQNILWAVPADVQRQAFWRYDTL
jgi:hypothetical protein